MACLSTFDIVAYSGHRYVRDFHALTTASLLDNLKDSLILAGWEDSGAVQSFAYLGLSAQPNAGDFFDVPVHPSGSRRYAFRTSVTGSLNVSGNVLIGGSREETLANLLSAINLESAYAGIRYAAATTANSTFQAQSVGVVDGTPSLRLYSLISSTGLNGRGITNGASSRGRASSAFWGGGHSLTSRKIPYCGLGSEPEDWEAQVKVIFTHYGDVPANGIQVESLSADETVRIEGTYSMAARSTGCPSLRVLSGVMSSVDQYPTGFPWDSLRYRIIANPYQFIAVVPGVWSGTGAANTSVICTVPQLPPFMVNTTPNSGAVRRAWYCGGASGFRSSLYCSGSRYTTFVDGIRGARLRYGNASPQMHLLTLAGHSTPNPLIYPGTRVLGRIPLLIPALCAWRPDPSDSDMRLIGFLWDAVVSTKGYSGDSLLVMDRHEFQAITHNNNGNLQREPGTLLIVTQGAV